MRVRPGLRIFCGLLIVNASAIASPRWIGTSTSERVSRPMTLADARPVLAALGDRVPAGLRDLNDADGERRWSSWLGQRDGEIRRRLATGDEDSVVNLMLYGTRFTRWPRATPEAIAASTSLPPRRSVATPISVASGWLVATMP